jgi:calpain
LIAADDTLLRGKPPQDNKIDDDNEVKGLCSGVYPPMFHYLAAFGIYVLRFFKDFKWRFVLIDDRLACKENGEIIYA